MLGRAVVLYGLVSVTLLLVGQKPIDCVTLPIIEYQSRLAPPHVEDVVIRISIQIEGFLRRTVMGLLNVLDLLDPGSLLVDRLQSIVL